MSEQYTCKVIYHFLENEEKVKQIQLFREHKDAVRWAGIQAVRGFEPVSVEDNIEIDAGMEHVGDYAPQVHMGHYTERIKYGE